MKKGKPKTTSDLRSDLEIKIAELERRVENFKDEVDTDNEETKAQYDDMLNELYNFREVGGPFEHMDPARVLEEVDPIAYRCGFVDWLNSEPEENLPGYEELKEELEEAKEALEELEEEE